MMIEPRTDGDTTLQPQPAGDHAAFAQALRSQSGAQADPAASRDSGGRALGPGAPSGTAGAPASGGVSHLRRMPSSPRSFKWVKVGAHPQPDSLPGIMVRAVDAGPRVLRLQEQGQTSSSWVWSTVDGAPVRTRRTD